MIKFARSKYKYFGNSTINLKMVLGDVFAVTSEIEESEVYQMGIATKNFVPITVGNMVELKKVVNLTDAIVAEFKESMSPVIESPVVPEVIEEPAPIPEEVTLEVQDAELEDVADDDESEIDDEIEEEVDEDLFPEEITVSFTELAGNVANAIEAISNETDIQKLNDALLLDERKSVKKAVHKRIEELESL